MCTICTQVQINLHHLQNKDKFAPGANLHPGCKFLKHRSHGQSTPRVQICSPGANLHQGANCAHERGLSPCLTGMRRVRDGFANRLAKPSRTVAKLTRNVRMVSQSLACIANLSRTGRQRFKHVILFCATKNSQNRRQVIAYVANPSRTRRQPFADVRKHIARKFSRSAQCDKYAT